MTTSSSRRGAGFRMAAITGAAAVTAVTAAAAGLAAPAGAATRPDAGGWRIVRTVTAAHQPYFSAVTATGLRRAWAFEAFQAGSHDPVAWQRTPAGWHRASFPGKAGEFVGYAASSGPGNVWAFTARTASSGSRALRWNGSRWSVLGSFGATVGGSAVLGPGDVWAFGSLFATPQLGARHWNGHRWTRPASGHGLVAGSGRSASDVWAVGGKQVAHWNGHTWSRTSVASVLPKNTMFLHPGLTGIWEQSRSSVWAVASGFRQDEGGPVMVLHFNGHKWSRVATRGFGDPAQVVPDGSGGLWIPVPGIDGERSQIMHLRGGKLSDATEPAPGPRRLVVWAIARVPGSTRVLGAGETHARDDLGAGLHGVILQVH